MNRFVIVSQNFATKLDDQLHSRSIIVCTQSIQRQITNDEAASSPPRLLYLRPTSAKMTQTNANVCRTFYAILSTFIRLVTLGYAALAIFAFFEIRELLRHSQDEGSFELRDGTLYVPLIMCLPTELPFDDENMIISTTNTTTNPPAYYGADPQCRQLNYLITACAASLLFAAVASVVYVFVDCLARCSCGPFNMSTSAGMGLFLCFILAQAGISTGALAEQNLYWVDYFQDLVDDMDHLDLTVKSYSSSLILISSALSAFGVAFLVLVDVICYRCCCITPDTSARDDEKLAQAEAEEGMIRQSMQIEEAAQTSQPCDSPTSASTSSSRPSWTTSWVSKV